MQLTKSRPPVEDIKMSSDGTYECALKIDGRFIFQSPGGDISVSLPLVSPSVFPSVFNESLLNTTHPLTPRGTRKATTMMQRHFARLREEESLT